MCGIFGFVSSGRQRFDIAQSVAMVQAIYRLSESRGKEAAGIALMLGTEVAIVKAAVRGRKFVLLPEVRRVIDRLAAAMADGRQFALMGHTRMVTNGGEHVHGNNQPVIAHGLAAIHNGIIVNDEALWAGMPELSRQFEVDTEVLLALVSRGMREGAGLALALASAMSELQGANSLALMSAAHDGIVLATSNGSMFMTASAEQGFSTFASERSILEKLVGRHLQKLRLAPIQQVTPGELVQIPLTDAIPLTGAWTQPGLASAVPSRIEARGIVDTIVAGSVQAPSAGFANRSREAQIEAEAKIDWARVRSLRRCTRCVLPETFPFIEFDADGVCSLCRNHKPLVLKGPETLRREFNGIRRGNGQPDLLMPLSGGRDSCYGLHLAVHEFGMKPVAYTYDWGMVTDLARRNISRMCGQLGIEHVLVSADIRRKRDFIRMNVSAWLKRPHLGTIPLFMAGDKQFFYYASMLKNEMGLPRTMLSVNPLERTDFKVGFCGINELYQKQHYYEPNFLNKLRLLGFYAGQFATNPGYVNASLVDSAFAYFSYYLIPKDYTSVFDYVPWNEHEIESVLLDGYDWEVSPDTKSTWRIGDGTAAFYNYIYLRVAGLTENDTFRSNQIREGLMTREEALDRIYTDNMPRVASLAWYFDAIGLDAVAALREVNRMEQRRSLSGQSRNVNGA